MQDKDENILTSSDKLNGFLRKINLWISHVEKKQLQMFPFTADVDPDGEVTSDLIINHLIILKEKMKKYFPSLPINEYDWMRNPFAVTSDVHLGLVEQEQLLELQSDRSLKLKFNELKLFQFWSFIKTEYSIITEIAINILLLFSTTYPVLGKLLILGN
jgi:hypothetical protein